MGVPNRDWAERSLGAVSLGLMALHVILTALYGISGLFPLAAVNGVCLIAGGIGLWLLRREYFRTHMLILYGTELIHLVFSALYVGNSAGFQFPLIGLTALVFLGEYLGRSLHVRYVPALLLGIADFAVYLLFFLPTFSSPGLLAVPASVTAAVQVCWSVVVFALFVAGMYAAVRMTSDSERVLTDKAQTDRLTGLYNRAGYDQLRTQIDRKTTTLLLLDGDKFKGINDRYGHETGDRVLKKIARELERNFRLHDCVCRIGGDEFAILMLNTEELDEEQIRARIGRVNRELSHTIEDKLPLASVSVGVARGSEAADWTELFNHADAALYEVKQAGGRGCRFY